MNWNEWIHKNYFTVIGIIIILCLVWYDQATVGVKVRKAVDNCNEYWINQVEVICPMAVNRYGGVPEDRGNISIDWGGLNG